MWPLRGQYLEFDYGDYKQEDDTKPKPPRRNQARCPVNSFIDAKAGVDGNTDNDDRFDNDNDQLDWSFVATDIEF